MQNLRQRQIKKKAKMTTPKPGDRVLVETETEEYEGILLPSSEFEKDAIIIKLENGYNIGIEKKRIKRMTLSGHIPAKKEKTEKIMQKKGLTKISILHTGGTIASKVDYKSGAVISKFTPEDLLGMFPELREIANIKSRFLMNMWSENMRFAHYNILAEEIKKEIEDGSEGIIITHGTDTIHYSAAALAFALEELPVPVLIVGAQRSSDRGSSDAALNLVNAAYFITKTDFAEVGICMHENSSDEDCWILPATKSRKLHTSRRDAFRPVNAAAWARVDYRSGKISFFRENYKKKADSKLRLRLFKEDIKVGIIRQHTNMFAEQFLFYENYDGLVIEATGLGNPPTSQIDELTKESGKILEAIGLLIEKGVVVVLSPQTIYGRLVLNVYENERKLQSIGVLGHLSDMTTETTFIKLAWLLSNYPEDKVKELITKNLRGEISERIEEKMFLI